MKYLTRAASWRFKRPMAHGISGIIQHKLTDKFSPAALEVTDESAQHAGHSGARAEGETHFRVRIVSDRFHGLSRIQRQRQIYSALADEIAGGVHALSLLALTPDEAAKAKSS